MGHTHRVTLHLPTAHPSSLPTQPIPNLHILQSSTLPHPPILFVFVVFHELAHSIIARHYGIKVRKIVLYPIGGVSEIEEITDNPHRNGAWPVAGPSLSLIIGFALLAISLIFTPNSTPILGHTSPT